MYLIDIRLISKGNVFKDEPSVKVLKYFHYDKKKALKLFRIIKRNHSGMLLLQKFFTALRVDVFEVSQVEMSSLLRVSPRTIQNIESGKGISDRKTKEIFEYLDLKELVSDLVKNSEQQSL